MTVWIENPFDNLPLEGYRPQRYWLMARGFASSSALAVRLNCWSNASMPVRTLYALATLSSELK